MKSIEELLRNLARPDVLEFGLVTNRLPSVNVGGRFEPVDDEAPSTDRVKQMLIAMGGGRFVETLSDRPVQWTTRLDGVGVIAVAAIMRKDIVQARFTVARREGAAGHGAGARPGAAVQTAPQAPPAAVPAMRPATGAHQQPSPPQAFSQTQQGTGPAMSPQPQPSPVAPQPRPSPLGPNPIHTKTLSSPPPPMTPPTPSPAEPMPPREGSKTDEWDGDDDDDDNEPTVQTLSPQTPQSPAEPRPKPARRPEEVRVQSPSGSTPTQTTVQPPTPPGLVTTPQEPPAIPPPPAEAPATESSSGPLEDVDIEITTNDGGAISAAVTDDVEGTEHTVEVVPKAAKAEPVVSAVPSTTPSGITAAPDKDRPRVDATAALDSFLAMAVAAHATDLHLAGGRPVLLRVASDLVARTQPISNDHVERVTKEILPPRLRETFDREGSCDFAIDHAQHGRFRVNVSRHRGGTTMAMRVLGRDSPSVPALGLPDVVARAVRHTQGLVLVTGPAGHGKTTTLAALVDAINANADAPRHVYTIEDPIEHVHPKRHGMVTQREIGTQAKSWDQAIDDALASDVDVVVIGDLRDEGAVRAAVTACEAGRLVLATMSCTNAASALDRLIERFPAAEQPRTRSTLASAIRLVVGQRLVPSADRTRLHVALETLPGSSALYALVRDGRTHQIPALQQRARSLGFTRLDDSLSELVRAQKVTLDVAKQFADSPADLAAKKG